MFWGGKSYVSKVEGYFLKRIGLPLPRYSKTNEKDNRVFIGVYPVDGAEVAGLQYSPWKA